MEPLSDFVYLPPGLARTFILRDVNELTHADELLHPDNLRSILAEMRRIYDGPKLSSIHTDINTIINSAFEDEPTNG